ncbi:MAG TPA: acyl-CoA dehydrogenase family protein [Myxococcota bacterium]|nr:acyl-CoA dehydrogenase family protein [Myxococcota bacterium]
MDFRFGDDPLLFQSTLRDFLAKEHTPEVLRALWETPSRRSSSLWQKLAALGVPGLLVPEAQGGLGMSEIEGVLLHEEAGRAALAEPLVATSAVAVPLLRELGGALAAEWLPRIAAGEARVAVGHPALRFVEDAEGADLLLLPQAESLYALTPAAARIVAQPANDPSRRIASVSFDAAAATRVAQGAQASALLAAALDRGALACAAQALGACDRMLELSVAYTSQRKQFGKPIGSYQAVKHMLANARVKLEYARPLVMRAAWSVARGVAQRAPHVSMAKLQACEAARFASRMALQCHGAIGYTWEQDLHLFMRRAESQAQAWGRAPFHLARVRAAILEGSLAIGPGATFEGGS